MKKRKTYDAKIDLHGKTQNEAHTLLERQLSMHKMRGIKTVLVITGKGLGKGKKPEEYGVLKRVVPMWIQKWKFVKGWDNASLQDGGSGAIYVYL